jgi:antitoxin HicB
MKYTYPAVFHKDGNSLWCEFPDLPGCQTFGDTITDTLQNAQEALTGYLLTIIEEKKAFAKPSDITQLKADPNSFVSLVMCTIPEKVKSVKKTLTIPAWLNQKAEAAGINFSQVLQKALQEAIV